MGGGGGGNEIEETPYQKELAAIAAEKWGKYQEKYKPIEDEYMKRVDAMDSQWQKDLATGSANKAVQSGFSDAQEQTEAQLFRGGINPNSGKFEEAQTQLAVGKANSSARGQGDAVEGQRTRYAQGIKSVVNMGQGQSIDAQQGISEAANTSAHKAASDAQTAFNEQSGKNQAIGNVVGMAGSAGLRYAGQPPAGDTFVDTDQSSTGWRGGR